MTRAVIYARYSSNNQRDASIEDQVRLCEEFVVSSGWTTSGVFSDVALSGANLLRPGIQAQRCVPDRRLLVGGPLTLSPSLVEKPLALTRPSSGNTAFRPPMIPRRGERRRAAAYTFTAPRRRVTTGRPRGAARSSPTASPITGKIIR